MPTKRDESFAEAVIRLKLADEDSVSECMKTVADGSAPSLAEAMVREGVLDRKAADRVLLAAGAADSPASSDSADDESPEIAGFEMLEKLGEGGMGSVWKARQTSLNRLVAIKVLPSLFSKNRKFIERFRREALATAKLNHPNIVSAIDVGVEKRKGEPALHYFVMEYVEGESLDGIIDRAGKIEPMRAAEIAIDVAAVLDHVWSEAGIVHRDIKPANILITRNGGVKVADLGLARSAWEDAGLTTAGLAIGTPHYASPEQAQGKKDIDTRSDIYALGATLFHMLTGRPVFEGDSAAAVMARHVSEDAPLCTSVNPLAPPGLSAVVAKMMQRNRADRYQTPGELRADLERFKAGDRPLAYTRMLAAIENSHGLPPSRPPEVFKAAVKARRKRRRGKGRHWPHALAASLFLGALGFALWYVVDKETGPAHAPRSGADPNPITLWFSVSNPDRVVGGGGSFPPGFSPQSRVRCHVTLTDPAYVYVMMASVRAASGELTFRLLAPGPADATPALANVARALPDDKGFYSLPSSADTVVLIAVASEEPVQRSKVIESLDRISRELSESGRAAALKIQAGRTLWYGHGKETSTDDAASRKAMGALEAVCKKVEAVFGGGPATVCAAAASLRGG